MSNQVCGEIEKLLRAQRHDFINHLQVIHALVQLGRTEKALKYIDELARNPELVSATLRQYRERVDRKAGQGL